MRTVSSQYALRAVVYLAQHADDWPIPGRIIARDTGIPAKYLSKILGDLVRCGVLQSSRGKTGGFSMHKRADQTILADVVAPFMPLDTGNCPFGNQVCSDDNPCGAHDRWKHVVACQRAFLSETSVADVTGPVSPSRRHP